MAPAKKGIIAISILFVGVIGVLFDIPKRGEMSLEESAFPQMAIQKENVILATSSKTTVMNTLKISSSSFEANSLIPMQYTCDGKNTRPDLVFSGVPGGALSLVLIMDDPDIPDSVKQSRGIEVFVHWIVFNIPSDTAGISEAERVPGIEGANSSGGNGYTGPCPPDREHRYFFKLYALDTNLDLKVGATKKDVEKAMAEHVIGEAKLIGRYNRARE